jgi:hypothetical protein
MLNKTSAGSECVMCRALPGAKEEAWALAASTVRGERHFNVETLDQSRRVVDVKVITCPGLDIQVVSTHGDGDIG